MVNPELDGQMYRAFGPSVFSERHDGVSVESREHTSQDGEVYVVQRGMRGWRIWVVASGHYSDWMKHREAAVAWADS